MKFSQRVTVVGLKASKGDYEGTAYDSTKAYVLVDFDTSKGTMIGQATADYTIGDSREIEKYRHIQCPFHADAEMEMVTTGKVTKLVMRAIRPVERAAPKA